VYFFRNNHFSTLYKYNGEIYTLVTDLGYLDEVGIVWEKLAEIDGDAIFCTSSFGVYIPLTPEQKENQLIAQLATDTVDNTPRIPVASYTQVTLPSLVPEKPKEITKSDYEIACMLQNEEIRKSGGNTVPNDHGKKSSSHKSGKPKKEDDCILI